MRTRLYLWRTQVPEQVRAGASWHDRSKGFGEYNFILAFSVDQAKEIAILRNLEERLLRADKIPKVVRTPPKTLSERIKRRMELHVGHKSTTNMPYIMDFLTLVQMSNLMIPTWMFEPKGPLQEITRKGSLSEDNMKKLHAFERLIPGYTPEFAISHRDADKLWHDSP